MAKKPKIYFKRNGTAYRLDKYPTSFNLLAQNWENIAQAYEKANSEARNEPDKVKKAVKSIFAKVPRMTISKERFAELQKDLKVKDLSISFYLKGTSGRFLQLSAEKTTPEGIDLEKEEE
tara:strand:- start:2477 stop:2836 length:360 start_codon:yes stop_codon:yes gene_type:complete